METPFGADFDSLNLDVLRAYFDAGPRAESLTWEAKGGNIRPEHVREGVCGFANSVLGGYLLLGVSRADPKTKPGERCQLVVDGWDNDDPATWIGSVLANGGVSPLPRHSVKTFPLPGTTAGTTRWVAVIHVLPSPLPPCITSDGEVFERLSGQTWRVNNSESLRYLFARGEAARLWARTEATVACEYLFRNGPDNLPRWAVLLAVAAPALSSLDVPRVLFRRSTAVEVDQVLGTKFRTYGDSHTASRLAQDSYMVWFSGAEGLFCVRADRDGGVVVGWAGDSGDDGLRELAADQSVDGRFGRMWGLANLVSRELGAYGPSYVVVRGNRQDPSRGPTDIAIWSSVDDDPSHDDLARITREAGRSLGRAQWEPEQEAPQAGD